MVAATAGAKVRTWAETRVGMKANKKAAKRADRRARTWVVSMVALTGCMKVD